MIVLYKTVLKDPKGREGWYFGIHQINQSDRVVPLCLKGNTDGYIGSGGLFQERGGGTLKTLKSGWVHCSTEIIKEVDSYSLKEERDLIVSAWEKFGVHPQVLAWGQVHHIRLPYKEGLVLNCQATSAENLWPTDGTMPPCNTKEALKRKSDAIRKKYEVDKGYRDRISKGLKEAFEEDPTIGKRGVSTKLKKYGMVPGVKEMQHAAMSKDVRIKAGVSRSASAPQWISPDYPEIEHTSLRSLCIKLNMSSAYSWYRKYGNHKCSFTYNNVNFNLLTNV